MLTVRDELRRAEAFVEAEAEAAGNGGASDGASSGEHGSGEGERREKASIDTWGTEAGKDEL